MNHKNLFCQLAVTSLFSVLSACGGGGSESSASTTVTVSNINASAAFADLVNRTPTINKMPSIDGAQIQAKILLGTEAASPFVSNGQPTTPTILKRIQLQLEDSVTTKLLSQVVWILYI